MTVSKILTREGFLYAYTYHHRNLSRLSDFDAGLLFARKLFFKRWATTKTTKAMVAKGIREFIQSRRTRAALPSYL